MWVCLYVLNFWEFWWFGFFINYYVVVICVKNLKKDVLYLMKGIFCDINNMYLYMFC